MVILFSVLAILGFAGTFILQRLKPYRRELGCLVLSLGLATAFVSPLKTVTAVQCPMEPQGVRWPGNLQRTAEPSPAHR